MISDERLAQLLDVYAVAIVMKRPAMMPAEREECQRLKDTATALRELQELRAVRRPRKYGCAGWDRPCLKDPCEWPTCDTRHNR